jgi:hypothetical protein
MADFQQTASAATAIQNPAAEMATREGFSNALEQNVTEIFARVFETPQQGKRYFNQKSTNLRTGTKRGIREMDGVIPQNSDADDLPRHNWGEGFAWTWVVYTYRDSITFERELLEIDNEGVVSDKQGRLARKTKRTTEFIMADVFNRGVDDGVMATGAPILCDDGMYLADASRPNPNPAGGTWSNLETAGAITEASLFQAQLNARQQVDENGILYPTSIKKVIIRPDEELTLFRLNESDLRVGTAQNDKNWVKGRWDIEIYDHMTTSQIMYQLTDSPGSDDNELYWYVRKQPEFKMLTLENPDIVGQRVRFSVGVALGSPRKGWRGGIVS